MESLNNLAITSTSSIIGSAIGGAFDKLQSIIANGGRDTNCKFYYNNGAGGSVLQVMARHVTAGAVSEIKDLAQNEFNSLLRGKKEPVQHGQSWVEAGRRRKEDDEARYGRMHVNDGKATVYALDDWGCVCPDALMLGVKVDKKVHITQNFPNYRQGATAEASGVEDASEITNVIGMNNAAASISNDISESDTLVWYDTTALITINSDKNVVTTRVAGRDYSRKELVSNGDIKFSVSGQITSGRPDVYPEEEVKKFIAVMQYKGVVKVNSQILDQFGIKHIVITDFSMSPKEGYKAMQSYSFSALGLQPERVEEITQDTITIETPAKVDTTKQDSGWTDMLKSKLDGLKSLAGDLTSQGLGLATGMLNDIL